MLYFSYTEHVLVACTCLMQCLVVSWKLYLHCPNPISLHYTYSSFDCSHLHFYQIHILRQIFWLELSMQMLLHTFAWCRLSLAISNICTCSLKYSKICISCTFLIIEAKSRCLTSLERVKPMGASRHCGCTLNIQIMHLWSAHTADHICVAAKDSARVIVSLKAR